MQQDHEHDDCRIQFRDDWLYQFYKYGKANRKIPTAISASLGRKLDMLQYGAAHAIFFTLIGVFLTIIIDRMT